MEGAVGGQVVVAASTSRPKRGLLNLLLPIILRFFCTQLQKIKLSTRSNPPKLYICVYRMFVPIHTQIPDKHSRTIATHYIQGRFVCDRWMQRNLEAVVNDGLPGMIKGVLDARVFRLDIILGILAPAMAESMTQLNVVARVLRLMVYRMDTAVRVIVFR